MAKYNGPKHRLARREGKNILDKQSATLLRRLNIPPGMHGVRRRRKQSDYAVQLRAKQVARKTYGVLESQFRKYYTQAKKVPGKTGEVLLQLLETRLDNLVYRLGFVPSRAMARQLVSHGHVTVNGKIVNIASYQVRPGEVISLSGKALRIPAVEKVMKAENVKLPTWLERKAAVGKLSSIPAREAIPVEIDEQLVVEFYSK